jgi:carboxypeptidase C (cathepsin A)
MGNKREEKILAGMHVAATNNAGDSVTEGEITLGGQAIAYRAVAGTITVGSSNAQDAQLSLDGKMLADSEKTSEQATARILYVACFKKDGAGRPGKFVYNGGPGGALRLHPGAFGPRRVVTPDEQHKESAPYHIVNNDYSLLDISDVVPMDECRCASSGHCGT